jgi:predicted DNA-binding protein (MmcQ/YjbR family)
MDFKIEEVSGIGEYIVEDLVKKEKKEGKIFLAPNNKAFCVLHDLKTVEIRTDANLSKVLRDKYESVMQSRYFGRGGIEIVLSGQISQEELYDLVRLSYNMTIDL